MKLYFKFNLLILILITTSFSSIQSQISMIIKFKDNSESANLLSSINKITFASSNVILSNISSVPTSYPLVDINKITFGTYSAVKNVVVNGELIIYPNPATNFIQLKNMNSNKMLVSIYSLDGIFIKTCNLENESQAIDINSLAKGLYFLKANATTLKFYKQ